MLAQPDLSTGHKDAVEVRYLPIRDGRLARMLSGPSTIARALRLRPDALYVVSLDLLPWAVLARLLMRRLTVVYDSNDEHHTFMQIKEWIPRALRAGLGRLVERLEPWLAARLHAATTALPATQERFVAAGVRSHLVRNFPPTPTGPSPPRGSFEFDVLLGGSLPEDQVALLAETGALARERAGRALKWLVAARNYGEAERALLENELTRQGVRDDFDLRYNVPFPEMQRLMSLARIGFVLYPASLNYAERIPIRIFEYMAAGVPFVASDLPTTSQFTDGHGVARLVPAGDPAGYADAIAGLLADPAGLEEMSRRGPDLARERYNWETESGKLVGLFSGLVGSPSGTGGLVGHGLVGRV